MDEDGSSETIILHANVNLWFFIFQRAIFLWKYVADCRNLNKGNIEGKKKKNV